MPYLFCQKKSIKLLKQKVDKFIMPAFVGANPWSEDDSIPVMSHATSALKDTWKRRPSVDRPNSFRPFVTREGWGISEAHRNAPPPRSEDPALHISSARVGLQPLKCVIGGGRRRVDEGQLELEAYSDDEEDEGIVHQHEQQQKQTFPQRYRSQVPPHTQQRDSVVTTRAHGSFAARARRQPNFRTRGNHTTTTATTTTTTTAFQTRKRITSSSSSSSLDSALGEDEATPWTDAAALSGRNTGGGFAARTTFSPWGAHDDEVAMGATIQSQPKTWIPFSAGLESQRLPFLQQRLMSHTHQQKRNPDPTPGSVTVDTYRDHGPEAYKRAHGIATPNPADPYRRHHPGARNTGTQSTSEGMEKGTLVRRTMLPNGEWVNMAPGYESSRCESPDDGLFRQTSARGGFLSARGASSNPNPTFDEREHWQVAATNRLAGTSLRNDPEKKLWPGVTGVVSGLNFLTSDVPLVQQHRWALDRLGD